MVAKKDFSERRKTERIRTKVPVSIVDEASGVSMETAAYTLDVSEGGLAFKYDDKLPLGTDLSLDVCLPSEVEPVKFKGTVSRLCRMTDDNGFFHGVQFKDPTDCDHSKLKNYLNLVDIKKLILKAIDNGASDLHLLSDRVAYMRVEGQLIPMGDDIIDEQVLEQLVLGMLTNSQAKLLTTNRELDFSFPRLTECHCRANAYYEMGHMAMSIRMIPTKIRTLAELGLPKTLESIALKRKGLIIVTGPSNSGKSTTLAALVDAINTNRAAKIITIEDPVEYVHKYKKSVVVQREIGSDTHNFSDALKYALRQDPDVIMVGEVRDKKSVSMAVTAAETGHLVLTTLHTSDTVEAINRILDSYPSDQQEQIRCQLADCLTAIVGQHLVPTKNGKERVLATELLLPTDAIRNMIRSGSTSSIRLAIEMGSKFEMHTLDQSLMKLVKSKRVAEEVARGYSRHPQMFVL